MTEQSYPVPKDEQQRMEALKRYEVVDTPPEEVFDRITRIVAAFLDVPIALISLVDETRQWFKSRVGLEVTHTGREIAFCAHTIMNDQLMIVSDTSQDKRFNQSPLVQGEPHIAFYAGAPLKTSDGYNLGTLCAIDTTPRILSEQQKSVLQDLADMVMDALELRLTNARVSDKIALQNAELRQMFPIIDI